MRVALPLNADRLAGLGVAGIGAYVAWASGEYPFGTVAEPGPGLLPLVLALVMTVFGVLLACSPESRGAQRTVPFDDLPRALLILGILGAAALVIERIGYRATVIVLLVVFVAGIERRNPLLAMALALGVALASFYLINDLLRVPLPVGPWGF